MVYSDHTTPRAAALKAISDGLNHTQKQLAKSGIDARVAATGKGDEIKLFIQRGTIQVKVEVNHVFRGTVLPGEIRKLTPRPGEFLRRIPAHAVGVPWTIAVGAMICSGAGLITWLAVQANPPAPNG